MAKESSSKTSSMSALSVNASAKEVPKTTKPIKLRAACNNCFSAKVRCDGNKSGCQRCSEKKLECVYSESRVGKVVGKRRKRPLDDSIGTIDSEAWVLNQKPFTCSLPSPAATSSSDGSLKRRYPDDNWTSFLVDEHQDICTFEESTEVLQDFDIANRTYSISSTAGMPCFNGLPTPAISPPQFSPPQFRYLSPAALEARPMSRQTSSTSHSSTLAPPRFAASVSATPEPTQPEDEETVCIKLLAHLKKHSALREQSRNFELDLLAKTNASVRRILRSKTIRSNYTCQMLLSSIITYLVAICERVCLQKSANKDNQVLQQQFAFETKSSLPSNSTGSPSSDPVRAQILEAVELTSEVGQLLKRRPYDGFQILGRHESHHVELDLRLQRAAANFDQ